MHKPHPIVFLLDVDNTLLDNDHITADLKAYLRDSVGEDCEKQYWQFFEEIRTEMGYADYLGALQRFRKENPRDPDFLTISSYLLDYPFPSRLFPGAIETIHALSKHGPTVILSDGDVVFQPRKIIKSGLFEAVRGRVLIYIHKEHELASVQDQFPAERYVLIDDKLRILTAVKKAWGHTVQTVFVRQGHYAFDPKVLAEYPTADLTAEGIGDVGHWDANIFSR